MNDCVLYQGLHDELGYKHLTSLGLYIPTQLKPVLQTYLLEPKVVFDKLQLFLERDQIDAVMPEGGAEQIGELKHHCFGPAIVRIRQSRDSLQRIEQKMRVELTLQRLEFACSEGLLELRTLKLLVANPREVPISMCANDSYEIIPKLECEQISIAHQPV